MTLNSRGGSNSLQYAIAAQLLSVVGRRLRRDLLNEYLLQITKNRRPITIIRLAILFFSCFFFQFVEAQESDAPNQKQIAKIEYYIGTTPAEETTEELNILRNQTVVYAGDLLLSRYAIRQSIKALYATQQYSQIQVYSQDTPDGIALTYQLTPFARIEQISLSGIPENEVKTAIENAMRSKQGGKYVPTIVKTDAQRIKLVCQAYGYFNAKVIAPDGLTNTGTLTYQVTVGDASTIKRLKIQDNTVYLRESP